MLLNDDLLNELQKLGGGGTRDRPEIRAAYSNSQVIGFAVSPAPEDIGESLHKFSSFCWHIPDNDLSARGNAHIFCNYFPEYKKKRDWDSDIKHNINQNLVTELATEFHLNEATVINQLTYYAYAILSSDFYLQKFQGKLFSVGGEWPKIPVTKVKSNFISIAEFGQELAKMEAKEFSVSSASSDIAEIIYYKYKLEYNCIKLIDQSGGTLIEYTDVPDEVLTFTVSGYNVLKEWLKMHSFPYYRKALGREEIHRFESLINKIECYQNLIRDLNILVEEIINRELYAPE